MNWIFSKILAIILFTAISACTLAQSAPKVSVSGGARTWFDAPEDGSNLPLAPYPVVIHAYDPGGVAQVELSVNGVILENLKPSDDVWTFSFQILLGSRTDRKFFAAGAEPGIGKNVEQRSDRKCDYWRVYTNVGTFLYTYPGRYLYSNSGNYIYAHTGGFIYAHTCTE